MADLQCKPKMIIPSPDMPDNIPNLSKLLTISLPSMIFPHDGNPSVFPASENSVSIYENYIRLPELMRIWDSKDFPNWKNESVLKPALQALEITFRLVSTVLSDPRPYANHRESRRRVEALAASQIQIIAMLCECEEEDSETRGTAPIEDSNSAEAVLTRNASFTEVWKVSGGTTVVSRSSEESLLPRLASWKKAEDIAHKIFYCIECEMRRCPYTLGLGEPNLAGKPNLQYDAICKPSELRSLRKTPSDALLNPGNRENQILYTTQQILESWIYAARSILSRIEDRIDRRDFEKASSDSWLVERIWKLLTEIEDIHLLMDPDDFLRLKSQLSIRSESDAFCFKSKGLVDIVKLSKDLKHKVPCILDVEVDPKGGPRIQEAAMKLYREKQEFEKIHVLQGLQAIESAMKRFFFAYSQVVVMVMGSLEGKGSRSMFNPEGRDSLSQIFLAPPFFPSLDGAKTFLDDWWKRNNGRKNNSETR